MIRFNLRRSFVPFLFQLISWYPGYFLLWLFCRLKVEGRKNLRAAAKIKNGRGVIFAANHSHELDPIIMLSGVPPHSPFFPFFFVTNPSDSYKDRERFGARSFLYGEFFFSLWGGFPLIKADRSYGKALANHIPILRAGGSMAVFPEGRMSKDGNLGEPKGGIGYLAKASEALIIPVAIVGAYGLTVADFFLRRKAVTIIYGAPLAAEEVFNGSLDDPGRSKDAARAIFGRIRHLWEERKRAAATAATAPKLAD